MHVRFFKRFTNPLNKDFYKKVREKQEERTERTQKKIRGLFSPSNKKLLKMIEEELSEFNTAEKMRKLEGVEYAEKKGEIISRESKKRLDLLVRELSARTNIPEEEIMRMIKEGKRLPVKKSTRVQMAKRL